MSQVPRIYDPKAQCRKISAFLYDAVEREKIRNIVKMFGYFLYRSMVYEKSFFLVGNGGNGKGTLIKIIEAFFGKENCSSESLHTLVSDRFAPAELYQKYVNTFADLKGERLPETGPFKMLTSGDRMSAQKKYGKRFQFRNFAKMVYSTNNPPDLSDNSYAAYRRLVIIPFDKTYEINDTFLADLTSEGELSGLLNLALKGWRMLKDDGGFEQESVEKIRQEYQYRSNNVKQFMDDQCKVDWSDPTCFIKTDILYEAYREFCKKLALRALEFNIFGSNLSQFGVVNKQRRIKDQNGRKERFYIGIDLKDQDSKKTIEEIIVQASKAKPPETPETGP